MRTCCICLLIFIIPYFVVAQDSIPKNFPDSIAAILISSKGIRDSAVADNSNNLKDSVSAVADNSKNLKDSASVVADNSNSLLDSVFTVSGDTLIGKVLIDKDNDRFIFESKDTFTIQLLPATVKKFTYNLVEKNGEKVTYLGILHDFYFLEFGENSAMRGYVRYTYRPVEDDGPKYHIVTKKYCYFKGKVPFFPRQESFKSDLLLLIDDCPKVVRKVQYRDIKIEEITQYVLEYNNCNGKIKK